MGIESDNHIKNELETYGFEFHSFNFEVIRNWRITQNYKLKVVTLIVLKQKLANSQSAQIW